MVRPKDLPQPVRDHKPHDSLNDSRVAASPGPCAYDGYGVTVFSKSRKLGFMPKAQRFRYSTEPSLGPVYNPQLPSAYKGVSFKGSRDAPSSVHSKVAGPGPGEYNVGQGPVPQDHAVSFTQGKRSTFGAGADTPAPSTYNPSKARPWNPPSAFFGSSTRASGASGAAPIGGKALDYDAPITPLDAMDVGLGATRPSSARVAFPKSQRTGGSAGGDGDARVGPGSYDTSSAARHVDRSVHGVVFGVAPVPRQNNDVPPAIPAPPPLNASSQRLVTPSVSFPKASYVRGVPAADTSAASSNATAVKLSLSHVVYTQIDPSSKVVAWRPPTAGGASARSASCSTTPGPGAFDIKSSLGGPQVGFTRGTRSAGVRRDVTPGPGTYSVPLPKRPESATQSFPQAKRTGLPAPGDAEGVPGPKYNPVLTPRAVAPAISFPKEKRDGRAVMAGCSSVTASYSPMYSHVDKGSHAAILYLTG